MPIRKKTLIMGIFLSTLTATVVGGVIVVKNVILPKGAVDSDQFIMPIVNKPNKPEASNTPAIEARSVFTDNFDRSETLQESGNMNSSSNADWWLNSGGTVYFKNGMASTIMGKLSSYTKWRLLYSVSNPTDTDEGYKPQNILRLVTRSKWKNEQQQVYFRVKADNLSDSPQRNESNGLLLFNRYQDGKNLYYVGLRVDGQVVVKKKQAGNYYTLAAKHIYSGTYDRTNKPNLLPHDTWLGLRARVTNETEGKVKIEVFTDTDHQDKWVKTLEVIDDGHFGGSVIDKAGFAGIRTDFMDVEFSDYQIEEI